MYCREPPILCEGPPISKATNTAVGATFTTRTTTAVILAISGRFEESIRGGGGGRVLSFHVRMFPSLRCDHVVRVCDLIVCTASTIDELLGRDASVVLFRGWFAVGSSGAELYLLPAAILR